MFETIINKRQNRLLRKMTSADRAKRIANLDEIGLVGIVFAVGSESEWNILYNFAREMEHQKKQVHLIGLQPAEMEISYIFTHSQTSVLHAKEDLNFWGIPKEGTIEGYTSRHYELLIDATASHDFFTRYVVAKSPADLKVAYAQEEQRELEQVYDLLIRDSKPFALTAYLEQIKRYLKMIQK